MKLEGLVASQDLHLQFVHGGIGSQSREDVFSTHKEMGFLESKPTLLPSFFLTLDYDFLASCSPLEGRICGIMPKIRS